MSTIDDNPAQALPAASAVGQTFLSAPDGGTHLSVNSGEEMNGEVPPSVADRNVCPTTINPVSPGNELLAAPLAAVRLPRPGKRRARFSAHWLGVHLLLGSIAFLMFLPFVWMVLTSLKRLSELGLTTWLPAHAQWSNYVAVFQASAQGMHFARFYVNSLLVASWATFLQVLTSAMAAFSFSRLRWPGRDRVFVLYLATLMLPALVMMVPTYRLMISFRLVDTLTGLILPASFGAFGTFLLRQFMLSIPSSIDEAARIDGTSNWRLFWDIILPLSRPGLIALAILAFIGNYQSFFWPLIMLRSTDNYTLPVGLLFFDSSRGQSTHLLMAAVTMSIVPMVIIFLALQRYLVKGIQLGAVKG